MRIINFKPVLGMVLLALLGACEHDKANARLVSSNSKLCYYDYGGTFGKSGIRAKEYIGKGPKMRSVQWKTLGFKDETQNNYVHVSNRPDIAAQLTWRTGNSKHDDLELYFDTLKLEAINIPPNSLQKVAAWQIKASDGTVFTHSVSELEGGKLFDTFSTESKGFRMPESFADILGGVNGGNFEVLLLDNSGNIIVSRTIMPVNGAVFKKFAAKAIDGLDVVVEEPQKCGSKVKGI